MAVIIPNIDQEDYSSRMRRSLPFPIMYPASVNCVMPNKLMHPTYLAEHNACYLHRAYAVQLRLLPVFLSTSHEYCIAELIDTA